MKTHYNFCTAKTAGSKVVVEQVGTGETDVYYYGGKNEGEQLFNGMLEWMSHCTLTLYMKSGGNWWKYKEQVLN